MSQISHNTGESEVYPGFLVQPVTFDTTIVSVGDHLDFRNLSDFKILLTKEFEKGTRNFILDFSKTKSFDSAGVGSLFALYKRLSQDSGMICFASASDVVMKTVEITRSYKIFPQYQTVEAAQRAVRKLRFS